MEYGLKNLGWLVICGWQGILAGSGYLTGTMIEALIQLNHPSYTPQRWEGTLLFWATIVVAVLINTVASRLLPPIEAFILVVHVLGFFAILIPVVYVSIEESSMSCSAEVIIPDGTRKGFST